MIGTMPDRRPGEGRYAKLEREQRWLVPTVPERAGRGIVIEDRYVTGTRLRLRRAEGTSGVLHKLAQKVRPAEGGGGPERVKITNLYLSEDEAAVLRQLPAAVLRKHRWPVRHECGDAPLRALYISPALGGPDPVWVCEESGRAVAGLGELGRRAP